MTLSSPMTWIRVSVIVQLVGLAIDGVWHGLLEPGAEPDTFDQMLVHLATVHLVLYLGIIGLFASTAWALVDRARRGTVGLALPVAFTGALIQTVAETWHAWMHLRLRPGRSPRHLRSAVWSWRSRRCWPLGVASRVQCATMSAGGRRRDAGRAGTGPPRVTPRATPTPDS